MNEKRRLPRKRPDVGFVSRVPKGASPRLATSVAAQPAAA